MDLWFFPAPNPKPCFTKSATVERYLTFFLQVLRQWCRVAEKQDKDRIGKNAWLVIIWFVVSVVVYFTIHSEG